MLLALTFHDGVATHYVDGESVSSHSLHGVATLRPGRLDLGNWPIRQDEVLRASRAYLPNRRAGYNRSFHGRIDEFSMLSKALTATDIRNLYENGRPR
jgi:hypothetical protein